MIIRRKGKFAYRVGTLHRSLAADKPQRNNYIPHDELPNTIIIRKNFDEVFLWESIDDIGLVKSR